MTTTNFDVKTVAADIARMYREDHKRWTKHTWARDASGFDVSFSSPAATCWCLRGAIDKRLGCGSDEAEAVYSAFHAALGGEASPYATKSPEATMLLVDWNDKPDRTVQEVIALCEKVAAS